jgi:cytochrome c-type biogenesis protein CcmH
MSKYFLTLCLLLLSVFFNLAKADGSELVTKESIRVENLSRELRCLVCQNQSIAESNAPLAKDLKNQINLMIKQEKTDQEIIDYLVTRYGSFILYNPPFNYQTALLWLFPFMMLAVGFTLLWFSLRKRAKLIIGKNK